MSPDMADLPRVLAFVRARLDVPSSCCGDRAAYLDADSSETEAAQNDVIALETLGLGLPSDTRRTPGSSVSRCGTSR
jgi:hypothetical protein